MIRSLRIQDFKSIRDVQVELGRVNLFIGGNGTGKSNVLEAIGIISAALNRGLSDSELQRKGVRLTPASLMKSAFLDRNLPRQLQLTALLDKGIEYTCRLTSSEKVPH